MTEEDDLYQDGTIITSSLRDPTVEELHQGPGRELPEEIQKMDEEEMACKYCGVSYFVFREIKTVKTRMKQHQQVFLQVQDFFNVEKQNVKSIHVDSLAIISELSSLMASLDTKCREMMAQYHHEVHQHALTKDQMKEIQQEMVQRTQEYQALEKQITKELTDALTNEHMKEIQAWKDQVSTCQIEFQTQRTELENQIQLEQNNAASMAQNQQNLTQELELDRQKILGLETTLESTNNQLSVVQSEYQIMSSCCEDEAKICEDWKHKVQQLEKNKVMLLQERKGHQESVLALEREITQLRRNLAEMQTQSETNLRSTLTAHKQGQDRKLAQLTREWTEKCNQLKAQHEQNVTSQKQGEDRKLAQLTQGWTEKCNQLKAQHEQNMHDLEMSHEQSLSQLQGQIVSTNGKLDVRADERAEIESQITNLKTQMNTEQQQHQGTVHDLRLRLLQTESEAKAKFEHQHQQYLAAQDQWQEMEHQNRIYQDQIAKANELQLQHEHEKTKLQEKVHAMELKYQELVAQSTDELKRQHLNDVKATQNRFQKELQQKQDEIDFLQDTVHRECLERTSLLERLKQHGKGKVIPIDVSTNQVESSASPRNEVHAKSSFYEKLRKKNNHKMNSSRK